MGTVSDYISNLAALEAATDALLLQNVKQAAAFVEGRVKESLSVRNEPRRRTKPRKDGGVSRMVGLNPSKEGEPPRVMEGVLRGNVAHAVTVTSTEVSGYVGIKKDSQANKYAVRLELGMHGTDKLGRNVNQGERPYLRPGVADNKDAIMKIICTGKAPKGSQHGRKRMSDVSGVTHAE
jgi:hypothetical protein